MHKTEESVRLYGVYHTAESKSKLLCHAHSRGVQIFELCDKISGEIETELKKLKPVYQLPEWG